MVKNQNSTRTLPCGRPMAAKSLPVTPKQLDTWQAQLRNFLMSHSLKYTEQRWQIAELILSMSGHLDAQELVDQVRQKHPNIGAATVYRTIKVLCEAAILKESLTDSSGRAFYELCGREHHDHVICKDCGEIFEFHDQKIETLQSAVISRMGFEEVGHRHVVYAHCIYKDAVK